MKYPLSALLLLLFVHMQAQNYYDVKILLNDGNLIEGEATLPSNRMFDKSIKRKIGISKKTEKIKNSEISKALYTLDNGNQYLFEYKTFTNIDKEIKSKEKENLLGNGWLLLEFHSDNIKLYVGALYYNVKNGIMVSNTGTGSPFWPYIYYFVQRPDEEYPGNIWHETFGTKDIGRESKYRKITSAYFADLPEVVEKIQDKTYKSHDLPSLVKFYNSEKQRNK